MLWTNLKLTLIAARDENHCIGRENKLPWPKNVDDMTQFKKDTEGKVCIMGRSTFESLPDSRLPGRSLVVMSRQIPVDGDIYFGGRVIVQATGVRDAIIAACQLSQGFETEVCVIGGKTIYDQFEELASKIILTEVKGCWSGCDTYLDLENVLGNFDVTHRLKTDNILKDIYEHKNIKQVEHLLGVLMSKPKGAQSDGDDLSSLPNQ